MCWKFQTCFFKFEKNGCAIFCPTVNIFFWSLANTVIDSLLMRQEVIVYARMITPCKQESYLHTVVLWNWLVICTYFRKQYSMYSTQGLLSLSSEVFITVSFFVFIVIIIILASSSISVMFHAVSLIVLGFFHF